MPVITYEIVDDDVVGAAILTDGGIIPLTDGQIVYLRQLAKSVGQMSQHRTCKVDTITRAATAAVADAKPFRVVQADLERAGYVITPNKAPHGHDDMLDSCKALFDTTKIPPKYSTVVASEIGYMTGVADVATAPEAMARGGVWANKVIEAVVGYDADKTTAWNIRQLNKAGVMLTTEMDKGNHCMRAVTPDGSHEYCSVSFRWGA